MRYLLLLSYCVVALAQVELVNPGFDEPGAGGLPRGWSVPAEAAHYRIARVESGCMTGPGCVEFVPGPQSLNLPGILEQTIPVMVSEEQASHWVFAMKAEPGAKASLQLVVLDGSGKPLQIAPIAMVPQRLNEVWELSTTQVVIPKGAERIRVRIFVWGGKAIVDSLAALSGANSPRAPGEARSVLNRTGLNNLMAFAKLFGVVRHFHPSDQAAEADWEALALEGVRRLDYATQPESLARRFNEVFEKVAPTVKAYVAEPPLPEALQPEGKKELMRWKHRGFGQKVRSAYSSWRETKPASDWRAEDLYTLELPRGLKARVPLAVFRDENGTLPRPAVAGPMPEKVELASYTANDRGTRLATVILAWNVFRHFYPYGEDMKVDWDFVLAKAMQRAAEDADADQFARTLRWMVAQLQDGHGSVSYAPVTPVGRLPLAVEWIENRLIVVSVGEGVDAKPGDELVRFNGTPVEMRFEEGEPYVSGATPQWKRRMLSRGLTGGWAGQMAGLELRRPGRDENVKLTLRYGPAAAMPEDPRPAEKVRELEPGIWYADLTRMTDSDWAAAVGDLAKARGIVFDLRGYPKLGPGWLRHLSKTPIDSPQWHIPIVTGPGQMEFERAPGWNLQPASPYLEAKRVILTHGGAISYAESTLGIIEHYKLCEIVGETTAGTNGNVNPFVLPGGYRISWTGMKVLKHDGSRHHGVGIAPTVPVSRTQAGVAAGRDEVLERGLQLLR